MTLQQRLEGVELQLLAGAVYGPDAAMLLAELAPEDFSSPARRDAWAACRRLHRERDGKLTELSLITDGAVDRGVMEAVVRMRSAVPATEAILTEFTAAKAVAEGLRICTTARDPLSRTPFIPADASVALRSVAESLSAQALGLSLTESDSSLSAVAEALIEELAREEVGLSTGVPDLDQRIGGLRPGSLLVLLARSGHGKSAFAGSTALGAAQEGHRVLYVSREMPKTEMALRFAACSLEEPLPMLRRSLRAGNDLVADEVRSALKLPVDVEDEERHIEAIAGRVDAMRAHQKPYRIVVLDFLQVLTAEGREQHERLERIAYAAKDMALRNACTVIGVAQPNRVGSRAEGLPTMSDIRGSSAIENAADVIVSMQRRDASPGNSYELNLKVEKARNGQPGGLGGTYFLGAGTFRVWQEKSERVGADGAAFHSEAIQ